MAFTRAGSSDTDASIQERAYGNIKGVSPTSPLTSEVTPFPSPRPGRSNLTFGSGNVDDPGRVATGENLAPLRSSSSIGGGGRQGSTGNPIGDALQKQLKRLAPLIGDEIRTSLDNAAIREGFGELDPNLISAQSSVSDSIAFGGGQFGTFSPASQAQSFGGNFGGGGFSAVPSVEGAILAGFNEGGFIRKRT